MTGPEPWTFGLEPLPQTREVAQLLRDVAGLVVSLDAEEPAVAKLIDDLRAAQRSLRERAPAELGARVGVGTSAALRPYLDHGRDIGAYNAFFPEYDISVDGSRASGTVSFPVAFEGPPGLVHGGVLATFFDCVVQHHNCDVGVAGKTTSLLVEYRRPTPLGTTLSFEVDREADDRRITSRARLFLGDDTLCRATMQAVAGDRSRLPHVAPRVDRP
jgi:hypothetical protein